MSQLFAYDEKAIAEHEDKRPWKEDPSYFKQCKVSSVAAMKMLRHALDGVDIGVSRGSDPVEIMGLLLGRAEGSSILISDCYALPVEGSETQVMADNDEVRLYMINKVEALEKTHKERLIGWYHSHPFDVSEQSNCFLSSTDIQTQWLWQHGLDAKWVAIVIDPLRSVALRVPEMACFRVYPPTHKPPQYMTPDGDEGGDDKANQSRWGMSYGRYYQLEIEYFMSEWGVSMLKELSKDKLWVQVLSCAFKGDNTQRIEKICKGIMGVPEMSQLAESKKSATALEKANALALEEHQKVMFHQNVRDIFTPTCNKSN